MLLAYGVVVFEPPLLGGFGLGVLAGGLQPRTETTKASVTSDNTTLRYIFRASSR
jgi:hypothetical protein